MTTITRVPHHAMNELIDLASRTTHFDLDRESNQLLAEALREAKRNGGELSRPQVDDVIGACCGSWDRAPSLAEVLGQEMRVTYGWRSGSKRDALGWETMPLASVAYALLRIERLGAMVCMDAPLSAALEHIKATKGSRSRITQAELSILWADRERAAMVVPDRVACKLSEIREPIEPRTWKSPTGYTMILEADKSDVLLSAYSPKAAKKHRHDVEWRIRHLEYAERPAIVTGAHHG